MIRPCPHVPGFACPIMPGPECPEMAGNWPGPAEAKAAFCRAEAAAAGFTQAGSSLPRYDRKAPRRPAQE